MPIGSLPEVPCASCHERIPGLAWGARCNACHAKRVRRANQLARRISLLAAVITAVVLRFVIPPGPDARMVFGIGTLGAFLTVRVIVKRVALEYLPE